MSMNEQERFDPETGMFVPPGVDAETGLVPPAGQTVAVVLGVIAAGVLYVGGMLLGGAYDGAFFAFPFFVGIVVGCLSRRRPLRNAGLALLLSIVLAIVTLQEGVVCVLFSLPLIVPETLIGALCGHTLRRFVRARKHQYFLSSLAVLASLGYQAVAGYTDDPTRHPIHVVTSATDIDAPPEAVFRTLTAAPLEVSDRFPWFVRIGLPIPRSLTIHEPGLNAALEIRFDQGVAYGHVTRFRPGEALSFAIDRYEIVDLPFHITRLGRGPHWGLETERVDDWLTLLDVTYRLERTSSGGTRLSRRTTFRRHLSPDFYFGFLQQSVIERCQARLLESIRERVSEAPEPERPVAVFHP